MRWEKGGGEVRVFMYIVCIFFHLKIVYDLEFRNSSCWNRGWWARKCLNFYTTKRVKGNNLLEFYVMRITKKGIRN